MRPDLTKVTVTRSGRLSPSMRFFTEGDARRYVFSETELSELKGVAEVISSNGPITAAFIVTELEKRGVERLLVEGEPPSCACSSPKGWPTRCAGRSIRG